MVDRVEAIAPNAAKPRISGFQALRTRMFEAAILLWSVPFGVLIVTLFQVWRPGWVVRRALRLWSSGFIFAARWIVGVRYQVKGRDRVPDHPVIFVCNHQSYWESIALTAFIADLNVISKAEAMDIPVFGWGLRHAPMIPVRRDRPGENLRRIAKEGLMSLSAGRSLLIFPEGTRVKPGKTRAHRRGLEMLYRDAGTEIVPVAHNAGLCWTKGFQTKHAGLVTLRFCLPIPPGENPRQISDKAEQVLNFEKDRLLEPPYRA